MPATPLHFLAIAFLGLRNPKRFDLVALFLGSSVVDLEPLYLILGGVVPNHQIWHSYLFVTTVYLAVISIAVWIAENRFDGVIRKVFSIFRVEASNIRHAPRNIVLSVLIGGTSHIFFDMFTHDEMPYVIFPFVYGNPFWLGSWQFIVEIVVVVLSLYSLWIWWKIGPSAYRQGVLPKRAVESE